MALIVEDGSVVAGADSYQSLADARTDAANRGLTLNADDTIAETQLRQSYYWLTNTYEPQLQGLRVSAEQTASLPRSGMVAYGFSVSSDEVPNNFKFAQVNAAASVEGGADLNAITVGSDLSSFEVVGTYKESYQDASSGISHILPYMPAVADFVKPYTKSSLNQSTGGLYREDMGSIC